MHFEDSCFKSTNGKRKLLKKDAVPSIFDFTNVHPTRKKLFAEPTSMMMMMETTASECLSPQADSLKTKYNKTRKNNKKKNNNNNDDDNNDNTNDKDNSNTDAPMDSSRSKSATQLRFLLERRNNDYDNNAIDNTTSNTDTSMESSRSKSATQLRFLLGRRNNDYDNNAIDNTISNNDTPMDDSISKSATQLRFLLERSNNDKYKIAIDNTTSNMDAPITSSRSKSAAEFNTLYLERSTLKRKLQAERVRSCRLRKYIKTLKARASAAATQSQSQRVNSSDQQSCSTSEPLSDFETIKNFIFEYNLPLETLELVKCEFQATQSRPLEQAKRIVSKFQEAAAFPSVSSGSLKLNGAFLLLESSWIQRAVEQKEQATYVRNHTIDLSNGRVISRCGPQDVKKELWNKTSPSGNYRAILRSATDKEEDKQYLEIYDTTKRLKIIDVSTIEKHGKIINDDGQFGTFEWSSSEDRLLYMAEKKRSDAASFYDDKSETEWGAEFEPEINWGQELTERVHPIICILDIKSNVVSVLENIPDDLSPGQAMWTPGDAGVVFCAWNHQTFRVEVRTSGQRESALYHLDLQKGAVDCLSSEGRSVRAPRFSPDQSRLVYLDTPGGGAHFQCSRLMMIDWATKECKVVVDVVRYPSGLSFPGLYTLHIQRYLWFDDNVHFAVETFWRSETAVVIINTDSGKVTRLVKADEGVSMSLLCVQNNIVFLSASSLSRPPYLLVAQLKNPSDALSCTWLYPDGDPQTVDWLTWKVLQHTPTEERKSAINENLDYESIICLPKLEPGEKQPPLIVFSHGGPHFAFSTAYALGPAFCCLCGYAVLMVNYRGSLGFGQDSIESLLGNVGFQDVNDVKSAVIEVIANDKVGTNRLTAFSDFKWSFTTHLKRKANNPPKTAKKTKKKQPCKN